MSVTSLSSDVNFIPEDIIHSRQREKYRKKGFYIGLIFVGIALVIGVAFLVYNNSIESQIKTYEHDIEASAKEVESLKDVGEKGYKLGARLIEIKKLIEGRANYSKLMRELWVKSPDSVQIKSWDVSGGTVTYVGLTPETYSPIAEFKSNLLTVGESGSDLFESVTFEEASLSESEDQINFTVDLKLKRGGLNERIE